MENEIVLEDYQEQDMDKRLENLEASIIREKSLLASMSDDDLF